MEYKKILEEQIEVLVRENELLIEPEQVRKNIETIIELVKTIASYLTTQDFDERLE